MEDRQDIYPSIEDYALISSCHCSALVSKTGSVDWGCMPRIDQDSCFGRLLDWKRGGHFSIAPRERNFNSSRSYIDDTMVLETCFTVGDASIRLLDFFAIEREGVGEKNCDHVRIVEGISGEMDMRLDFCPRFDYGEIVPRTRSYGDNVYASIGSNKGLAVLSDIPLDLVDHRDLAASFRISAGQRVRFVVHFEPPECISDEWAKRWSESVNADKCFHDTCLWWHSWAKRAVSHKSADAQTVRSAIVLKSLTFERTGAIVAAPTTSLPEWVGGERNWDYRFSWVRDSVFTVRALYRLGYEKEADRFLQFIQRSSAGSAAELQIMYGVDGKRRLTEIEIDWLEGYRNSKPVRIGNLASEQVQLDVYGEILELAWIWHAKGLHMPEYYSDFLVDVADTVCREWERPDHGIWEFRGEPSHFVYSKATCWGALNHGIKLVEEGRLEGPVEHWMESREKIRTAIENDGYDKERGVFVQAFGSTYLDSALLLMPRVGFINYDDPRMLRTVDAICNELDKGGLLLRYNSPDSLSGPEGAFIPCTFWLVSCLARQGRRERAEAYYQRALKCANELGLFSEEYDAQQNRMLGNFPQALTHVSQIVAAMTLAGENLP